MKRKRNKYCMILGGACFAALLGGCISIGRSSIPRFYLLQAVEENQVSKKYSIASDTLIGIGPVKIPEYHDRPQIVTQDTDKMLKFAEFDRWGEPLDLGTARLIRDYLTVMVNGANFTLFPWSSSLAVRYQVIVEIIQLESELDRELFLAAQWMIIDTQNAKTMIIKRSEFRQPVVPQDYSGLAKTLSTVCGSLSLEIGEALSTLKAKN